LLSTAGIKYRPSSARISPERTLCHRDLVLPSVGLRSARIPTPYSAPGQRHQLAVSPSGCTVTASSCAKSSTENSQLTVLLVLDCARHEPRAEHQKSGAFR